MQYIENRTFDELQPGDSAELSRILRPEDMALFAALSGDANPAHIDSTLTGSDDYHNVISHGMWGGALIAALIGSEMPGPGSIYLNQSLNFTGPVDVGDTVTVRLTVQEKHASDRRVVLACLCTNGAGATVVTGTAEVIAPDQKIRRARIVQPGGHLHVSGAGHRRLIDACASRPPLPTAVIHPCDALSLKGALEAAQQGLILPILVGPTARSMAVAEAEGLALDGLDIHDTPHSHASAEAAVAMAREGRVGALMKGALHTDEVLGAVVRRDTGLRTERRITHIFALDVPHHPRPLFITDGAVNITPDLGVKRDIVQNAIDLAHALGIACPRVAILSAVETVTPEIISTVDAAALCKMADRGQITGGLLDGPLAFDNAVSAAAAATKGITSAVAGLADILVAPDLVSGNMLAKQLIHLAGADSAGLALGAKVPIILTSRSDDVASRIASAAMANLYAAHFKIWPKSDH